MANYNIHDNPVRDEWIKKIGSLNTLAKGVEMLNEFRLKYTTPLRASYDLELDWGWIECKLEEKVALLKHKELNDQQIQNQCANGADAQKEADAVLAKMAACTDKFAAEKIHIGFRQAFKPPMMPVNVFMDTDRILGTKLMELRNTDYYEMSLEDLRKVRGVRVVTLQ
ncbi:aromatic/alkene monooxygenase hydroxylase subunit gamma [Methylomonas sp. MED-D]|uniref:Methane monooxygenase n=1 Tax=Methylomonas koyamae TaxID=702114 RepID=A0A177NL54_9GAMM|nr:MULTISPECIES: methane monooxygenase [Methylomonas]NJA04651.1 methane monooxygenase [Methylococcaceae bacterium WWC4]MDT4332870.1 methane monooxygenase [Methylomonas sp. MV1]OAI18856.1 methane monooxygenase [Methylomonas koyamae]OHX34193.1 methane monooxygenase [Methylomonas sp. LWB]WGS86043.1 methane monooxygenase [Methylomonas sp. UP202]